MGISNIDSSIAPLDIPKGGRLGTAAGRGQAGYFAKLLHNLNQRPPLRFSGLKQPGLTEQTELNLLASKTAGKEAERLGLAILADSDSLSGWGVFKSQSAAGLAGLSTPGEFLLAKLNPLAQGNSIDFKLSGEDLGQLAAILAESGADDDLLEQALASLADGSATLNQLILAARQALGGQPDQQLGGLTVRADTLPALGQLLIGLGLSPEVAKNIQNQIETGQKFASAGLKPLLQAAQANSPLVLTADNLASVQELLATMEASPKDLKLLEALFNSHDGQLPLDDFLNFLDRAGSGEQLQLSREQLKGVDNWLAKVMNQQQNARLVEFNKTMSLLSALGDQEIDDNFKEFSPALQALRGGLTGSGQENSARGGGTGSGQGHGERHGGQGPEREALTPGGAGAAAASGTKTSPASFGETLLASSAAETIAQQIAGKMIYSARQGLRRLTLKLNSEYLGPLDIDLKVKGQKLSASLTVETPEAGEALQRELASLKASLAEAGLIVDQLDINWAGGQDGHSQPNYQNPDQTGASLGPKAGQESPRVDEIGNGRPFLRPGLISRLV